MEQRKTSHPCLENIPLKKLRDNKKFGNGRKNEENFCQDENRNIIPSSFSHPDVDKEALTLCIINFSRHLNPLFLLI